MQNRDICPAKILTMKKGLFTIVLFSLIFSCKTETTSNSMTVSGKVSGLKKGTLYLQHIPDSMLEPETSGEGFTWYTNDGAKHGAQAPGTDWAVGGLPASMANRAS